MQISPAEIEQNCFVMLREAMVLFLREIYAFMRSCHGAAATACFRMSEEDMVCVMGMWRLGPPLWGEYEDALTPMQREQKGGTEVGGVLGGWMVWPTQKNLAVIFAS